MSRSGRLHGIATSLMALFAVTTILITLAFIMVRWPGETGMYVKVGLVASIIGFLSSASVAVLAAARDTYFHERANREMDD